MSQSYLLKEIQLLFNVDQHILIHLCEKGVIIPDIENPTGRGKSRRFSKSNIFEFALALELRKFQIPVLVTGAIVRVIRSFEKRMNQSIKSFQLPDSLVDMDMPLYLYGGELLVFQVGKKILSFDVSKILNSDKPQVRFEELDKLPNNYQSYLKVDLSALAKKYS